MEYEELERILYKVVALEMRKASHYASRLTIYLRVVKICTDMLEIPWSVIQEMKNYIPVDREWQRAIERMNESCSSSPPSLVEETTIIEKVLSRDYVKQADLIKLATLLAKKKNELHTLWYIFAVDGIDGPEPKRYFENLAYPLLVAKEKEEGEKETNEEQKKKNPPALYPDYKAVHANAVRALYWQHDECEPEMVAAVIKNIIFGQEREKEEEKEEGKELFLELKRVYLENIGTQYRDPIIQWKKQQILQIQEQENLKQQRQQQQSKSDGCRKRKRKDNQSTKKMMRVILPSPPSTEEEEGGEDREEEEEEKAI